jgi:hypothetical protein
VFSPDGRSIAYWGSGSVRAVPTAGGTPVTIATLNGQIFGLAWDASGIVYGWGWTGRGWRIERAAPFGGPPETLAVGSGEEVLHAPQILPGRQHLLFSGAPGLEKPEASRVVVQSLKSGQRTTVLENAGGGARYVSSGHLIYASGGTVHAVPFDVTTLAVQAHRRPLSRARVVVRSSRTSPGRSTSPCRAREPPSIFLGRQGLSAVERGALSSREGPRRRPSRSRPDPMRISVSHVTDGGWPTSGMMEAGLILGSGRR